MRSVDPTFPPDFQPTFDPGAERLVTFSVEDDGSWTSWCGQAVDAETDHPALARPPGPIGFKGHHEHVEFRNLRIKELP